MYGYFEIQALLGITKHLGGLTFTRRLVERCGIDASTSVLYVGLGNGSAAAKIVAQTGCDLVGIDLLPAMASIAERAEGERCAILAGDAESLPFADGSFDAVLSESVTAFTRLDRSLPEFFRVLTPGGRLGLNETTWLTPPTPEMLDYVAVLDHLSPRAESEWRDAIARAGFDLLSAETGPLRVGEQFWGELKMIDRRHLGVAGRFFSLLVTDGEFRQSLLTLARSSAGVPKGFLAAFGYGLYVAQK